MPQNFTTFAFTDSVRDAQSHYGSRSGNARMEQSPDRFVLTDREKPFIESRDGFYLGSVGENGWPYVQFRGGPRGFLRVLDDRTLGYADFRGNRQYISTGNINATEKVSLFLMDYPSQSRLKIWALAKIVDAADAPELVERLAVPGYDAKIERAVTFEVQAYDWNCPQHITPRYTLEELEAVAGRL